MNYLTAVPLFFPGPASREAVRGSAWLKRTVWFWFLLLSTGLWGQGWPEGVTPPAESSQTAGRPVLLVFSGSDWCGPCIRLQQETLASPDFKQYADDHLLVMNADFPRKKKNALSAELTARNRALAERYNPQGRFPLLLLLQPDGRLLGEVTDRVIETGALLSRLRELAPALRADAGEVRVFERTINLMGSRFEFALVSADPALASALLDRAVAEVQRIERLISSWDPGSQTSAVNRAAGRSPVAVDPELLGLVQRACRISELTQGAFDITVGPLLEVWRFDGSMTALPDPQRLEAARSLVDYHLIELDADSGRVYLQREGMRIGFGALGKGYAANRVRQLWRREGVPSGVVNAGGDLVAWGRQPNGEPWQVGIADPLSPGQVFSWLPVTDQAVVTSGDYERHTWIDGRRYAHILDPRTGYPAEGVRSVTVVAADAELADALATAVFVLGKDVGLDLIEQLPGVECILVDATNQLFTSSGLELNPAK